MKRFIICSIMFFVLFCETAYASVPFTLIPFDEKPVLENVVIDGHVVSKKYLTHTNGQDYVVGGSFGQTAYNLEEQRIFENMDYISTPEYYMAVDRGGGPPMWYTVPLRVYDKEFNLIAEQEFANGYGKVVDVSYAGGKYYCCYEELYQVIKNEDGTINYQTFGEGLPESFAHDMRKSWPQYVETTTLYSVAESVDGLSWTTIQRQIQGNGGYRHILPHSNGTISVARQAVALNNTEFLPILYEKAERNSDEPDFLNDIKYVNTVGDWFLFYDGGNGEGLDTKSMNLYFSYDNTYFITIELPETFGSIYLTSGGNRPLYAYEYDEYIYVIFQSGIAEVKIPKKELYAELEQLKETPYIQCNGTVLGFEEAPVIENDRILVPMRFLFEQMGADVQWDESTQSAIAENAAQEVSFSVDSMNATVNGSLVTMDVPARLINDKTMVPLRFLSENLGYDVTWDENLRLASILAMKK